ncbi:hypothetical protein TGME49_262560 [Toxoplasma gondii ME49]|uniref:Transmembrane protein n=3 Tax=Toxoplasma gondii TaxID=5811 RepID=A0A2G8YDW2_TOXGO|nr:hypothetical protein TGME49_262560 [Toxoplasma gondii ME49]EPT29648.1 hypothetical protein TGME49_262560 [Toxoplasma gondii ME49]KYF40682.1 hypothetical protein TGARI_262560 [Toxoplasma gondii ARI]PIM05455.1 hypothetical protein TGCOUG_262560 [Toxoplasma gondii COUG]|eukprot:XP_002365358.1 hypothetical protein TGME49_262560 [Toxoplasma gondii ME49]
MQTSLAPGAKWPVLLLAALAALLPHSATAHATAQLHQNVLSTTARPARCSAQHPEVCSSSPSANSEAETSKLSAVSKAKTGGEGPSVSAGRGDWERCRAASSSLSSQRTLGPGVHSSSACNPAASPLPPLALAEVEKAPAAAATAALDLTTEARSGAAAQQGRWSSTPPAAARATAGSLTDAPKQVTFMEALGRAAAAEAAALGGGAWNFNTWGLGAFFGGDASGQKVEKKAEKNEAEEKEKASSLWGGDWREAVSDFFAKVDKRMDEANGMLHYTDLYGFLV